MKSKRFLSFKILFQKGSGFKETLNYHFAVIVKFDRVTVSRNGNFKILFKNFESALEILQNILIVNSKWANTVKIYLVNKNTSFGIPT